MPWVDHIVWQWMWRPGDALAQWGDTWVDYLPQDGALLEHAKLTGQRFVVLHYPPTRPTQTPPVYHIDLHNMIQRSVRSGKEKRVRRCKTTVWRDPDMSNLCNTCLLQ